MNKAEIRIIVITITLSGVMLGISTSELSAADLQAQTLKAWNSYVSATEKRIAVELKSGRGFLVLDFQPSSSAAVERRAVLSGNIRVTKMETADPAGGKLVIPDGMIHHWRGSVFVPGANLEEVLARVANPKQHDTRQEDVLRSSVLEKGPDFLRIYLKLQRSKFVTVVYNTEHSVRVQRFGPGRAMSTSVATRIAELDMPNSSREHEMPEGHDHGFLWRLTSYWRYEQVDGGVIVECESISLSRSVPSILEWFIRPLIDSTARESMHRTLGGMRDRMSRAQPHE